MNNRSVMCVLFIFTFLFLSNSYAAETNYKWLYQLVRSEQSSHDEADGHAVVLMREKYIFNDGFAGITENVAPDALVMGEGEWLQTETVTFDDGESSSITIKRVGSLKRTELEDVSYGEWTGGIVAGSGRFAGIHGTERGDADFRVIESGNVISEGYGKGAIAILFIDQFAQSGLHN